MSINFIFPGVVTEKDTSKPTPEQLIGKYKFIQQVNSI